MAEDADGSFPESWEDIDNAMLDRRVSELSLSKGNENQDVKQNSYMVVDPNDRTPYQPQVRILKRASDTVQPDTKSNNQSVGNKPTKTLEQREAEYAEARLRIMGASYACGEPEPVMDISPGRPIAVGNLNNNSNSDIPSISVLRQPKGPDIDGSKGFKTTPSSTR